MKTENQPAFPVFANDGTVVHEGLTRFEYFTAQALNGLLASGALTDSHYRETSKMQGCKIDTTVGSVAIAVARETIRLLELNKQ
jgi:hypothetical protein